MIISDSALLTTLTEPTRPVANETFKIKISGFFSWYEC